MILIFTLAQAEGKLKEYPLDGMRFYELISSFVFTLWSGVPPLHRHLVNASFVWLHAFRMNRGQQYRIRRPALLPFPAPWCKPQVLLLPGGGREAAHSSVDAEESPAQRGVWPHLNARL